MSAAPGARGVPPGSPSLQSAPRVLPPGPARSGHSPGTAGPRPRRGPGRPGGPWRTARLAGPPGVPPVLPSKRRRGCEAECAPSGVAGRPPRLPGDPDSPGSGPAGSRPRLPGRPAAAAPSDARGQGSLGGGRSCSGNFRFPPRAFNPRVGEGRPLPGFVSGVFAGKRREGGREGGRVQSVGSAPRERRGLLRARWEARSGNPRRVADPGRAGHLAAAGAREAARAPSAAAESRVAPRSPAGAIRVNTRGAGRPWEEAPRRSPSSQRPEPPAAGPAGARRGSGSAGAAPLYPAVRPHG